MHSQTVHNRNEFKNINILLCKDIWPFASKGPLYTEVLVTSVEVTKLRGENINIRICTNSTDICNY